MIVETERWISFNPKHAWELKQVEARLPVQLDIEHEYNQRIIWAIMDVLKQSTKGLYARETIDAIWLRDHNGVNKSRVFFENTSDAVMFKLTWQCP